jgi:hypothetical protein
MTASFTSTSIDPDNLLAGDTPPPKIVSAVLTKGEVVVRGHVLGRVTADEKMLICLNAATDGSETPRYIAAEAADATAAEISILVFAEGEFNQDRLTFGTGTTIANSKVPLMDVNIHLVDPVTNTPA